MDTINPYLPQIKMKTPHIKEEEIQKFNEIRYSHPLLSIRKRAAVLYFKVQGYPHNEIESLADVSSTTVTTVLKMYEQGGLERVLASNYKPHYSELEKYKDEILHEFEENPPSTLKEASHRIFQLTGILRSRFSLSKFLKKLKLRPLKTGSLPAKADPLAQAEFKKKN